MLPCPGNIRNVSMAAITVLMAFALMPEKPMWNTAQ
jgi:hypothetical protein